MIGLVIFAVGFSITLTYVFFFMFNKKEEERKENHYSVRDDIDYDGHGNWGRFPVPKEKKKTSILK